MPSASPLRLLPQEQRRQQSQQPQPVLDNRQPLYYPYKEIVTTNGAYLMRQQAPRLVIPLV